MPAKMIDVNQGFVLIARKNAIYYFSGIKYGLGDDKPDEKQDANKDNFIES